MSFSEYSSSGHVFILRAVLDLETNLNDCVAFLMVYDITIEKSFGSELGNLYYLGI